MKQCRQPRIVSALQDSFLEKLIVGTRQHCWPGFSETRLCWANRHFNRLTPFGTRSNAQRRPTSFLVTTLLQRILPSARQSPPRPFHAHLLSRRDTRTFEHFARICSSCCIIPDLLDDHHLPEARARDATGHTARHVPVSGERPPRNHQAFITTTLTSNSLSLPRQLILAYVLEHSGLPVNGGAYPTTK